MQTLITLQPAFLTKLKQQGLLFFQQLIQYNYQYKIQFWMKLIKLKTKLLLLIQI